jgi:aquaglyceroporin related protein, other eukaryote
MLTILYRETIREAMAEFIGTMVLVFLGTSVSCQVTLGQNPAVSPGGEKGQWISIVIGWASGESGC